MKFIKMHLLATACLLFGSAAWAVPPANNLMSNNGQPGAVQRRPTVSPYVALGSNNGLGAINYFSYVRPLEQQQAANRQQRAALQQLDLRLQQTNDASQARPAIRSTGYPASFMTHHGYFGTTRATGR